VATTGRTFNLSIVVLLDVMGDLVAAEVEGFEPYLAEAQLLLLR
jgi:hypothetical protein